MEPAEPLGRAGGERRRTGGAARGRVGVRLLDAATALWRRLSRRAGAGDNHTSMARTAGHVRG